MACESTLLILDAQVSFMEPAECQRAEIDIPDAIGVADDHALSVRGFAPVTKRLQRTVVHASTLAYSPAADLQYRSARGLTILQ